MAFKDFAVGEILTSSDVDTYLMSQVIIRCTSATRPASPAQGWHIYETDTSKFMVYNGTSWVDEGVRVTSVVKSANEGTTSTTDHSDLHLVLPVTANTNYWVKCFLITNGTTVTNFINIGWQVPAGATFNWMSGHLVDDAVGNITEGLINRKAFAAADRANSYLAGTANDIAIPIEGSLRVAGTAGSLQLRWYAVFSDTTQTFVKAGSLLVLMKLS